jgi:hypothetical protein
MLHDRRLACVCALASVTLVGLVRFVLKQKRPILRGDLTAYVRVNVGRGNPLDRWRKIRPKPASVRTTAATQRIPAVLNPVAKPFKKSVMFLSNLSTANFGVFNISGNERISVELF